MPTSQADSGHLRDPSTSQPVMVPQTPGIPRQPGPDRIVDPAAAAAPPPARIADTATAATDAATAAADTATIARVRTWRPIGRSGDRSAAARSGRSRRALAVGVMLVVLGVVVASAFLPWEWSFIDDGAMISQLHLRQDAFGPVQGAWAFTTSGWRFDLDWGLFRPAFWVVTPLFYSLPVGAAHAVRVGMLLIVVLGAAEVTGRRYSGRARLAMMAWTVAAVAADTSLYAGVYYPSLQELSGLFLVTLGLLARRHPAVRLLAWTAAAWFKAPFAWLLLAYGILLVRERRTRRLGAVYCVLGAGTLAVLALVARTGTYSHSGLSFTGGAVLGNLGSAVTAAAWVSVVLLVGLVLTRARVELNSPLIRTRPVGRLGRVHLEPRQDGSPADGEAPGARSGRSTDGAAAGRVATEDGPATDAEAGPGGEPRPGGPAGPGGEAGRDPVALALVAGGLGYLANLLVWHAGGYYASGYLFPLTVGILLGIGRLDVLRPGRLVASALVPVLLAAPVVRAAVRDTWQHNEAVVGLRDCLLRLPGAPTVGFNRHEAWQRLDFVVRRHDPSWAGRVVLVPNGATVSSVPTPAVTHFDYYIHDTSYGPGTPSLMTGPVVCTAPTEVVYQVVS